MMVRARIRIAEIITIVRIPILLNTIDKVSMG